VGVGGGGVTQKNTTSGGGVGGWGSGVLGLWFTGGHAQYPRRPNNNKTKSKKSDSNTCCWVVWWGNNRAKQAIKRHCKPKLQHNKIQNGIINIPQSTKNSATNANPIGKRAEKYKEGGVEIRKAQQQPERHIQYPRRQNPHHETSPPNHL